MTVDVGTILAPVVVAGLGYVVVLVRGWLVAHTRDAQYKTIVGLARQVVEGVEQALNGEGITGAQKYEWASDALVLSAKRLGVTLDDKEVAAFLNSAVKAMKNDDAFAKQSLSI